MAPALPKYFALYSPQNGKYLAYVPDDGMIQGFLKFSAEDLTTDLTKFEVVESNSGDGLVHIKCSYNNKYWRRWSSNLYWIAAEADDPVENQSKWSCTLFEPVFVNGNARALQLRHVQLQRNAFSSAADYEPYTYCFSTAAKARDANKIDTFTIINLASSLPEEKKPEPPLERPEDDKPAKRPEDDKPTERPEDTKPPEKPEDTRPPEKPEDDTTDGQTDTDKHSSEGNKSPSKKYEILDVIFDVDKATISPLDPVVTYRPVRNDGNGYLQEELDFDHEKIESGAWKSDAKNNKIDEINTNVVTELISPVPVMVNDKNVRLGPQFSGPYRWGQDLKSEHKSKSKYKVIVPPKTRYVICLEAARANVKVPFSYTRRDIHVDGPPTPHPNLKGEYHGDKTYKFTYKLMKRS